MRRLYECALRLLAPLVLLLLLLAGSGAARADTTIALWKSFDGRVNFTGTQVTLRTRANNSRSPGDACVVAAPGTVRKASLSLPLGATVLSAQLYWAGSGIPDSTVTFEGKDITAGRKFSSTTVGNGFNYFGGAADVTGIVQAKGSGSYSFSGLTVSNGAPWCASQGVLGGFSLLVVYAHPTQPERVLNLYEGFRYLQNSELVVNASNFRWNRTSRAVQEKARVGHISWEGDPTLAQDGERLLFEGTEMIDALNPEGNQFNSRSNINGDSASYGIDFDVYDTTVTIASWYDALVTTRYRTGQDLVILNAEVLLVPTMPVSDLSIAIARSGALSVGADVQYTITVANDGPYTEAGPITVSNTLPAGMSYVSGGGTGWTCSVTGAAGSCVYRGALAPGARAPALVVRATVTSAGEKSNTVTVKGTDDDDLSNNTATDTGTAPAPVPPPTPTPPPATPALTYAFTDKTCTAGVAFGTAGQCKKYDAATVGGSKPQIFLTALIDGVPAAPSATAETTATLQFRLECLNPSTCKTGASYAGASIPATAADPWSAALGIKFPARTVSLAQDFVYNDVGRIKLHLKGAGTASTEEFVSAPRRIDFKLISNGSDKNPGSVTGSDRGFAQAGAPLTLQVGALLFDGKTFASNFGNENPRAVVVLAQSEAVKLTDQGKLAEIGEATWADGIRSSKAAWSEVGAVNFVIGLADNQYLGVATPGSTVAVGRFYPAYFKTDALGPFGCPASLPLTDYPCPRGENGAVYSGQPFDVTVTAYNADNQRVQNFTGEWFKTITLHAAKTAGGDLLASDFTPPTGATATTIGGTTSVPDADGKGSTIVILGKAAYKLADAYSNAKPRSVKISDPTTVHVRAVAVDSNLAGNVAITSKRGVDEVSDEAGILALSGRLAVPNALGTDILRTPLGLRAEYWAGAKAGWLFNPGYGDALGADAGKVKFITCSPSFANADGSCNTAVLAASTTPSSRVTLVKGAGVLWLRLTGKLDKGVARTGVVTLEYNGWPWLPSTLGRVSFGSHRSPVIYVRELYY